MNEYTMKIVEGTFTTVLLSVVGSLLPVFPTRSILRYSIKVRPPWPWGYLFSIMQSLQHILRQSYANAVRHPLQVLKSLSTLSKAAWELIEDTISLPCHRNGTTAKEAELENGLHCKPYRVPTQCSMHRPLWSLYTCYIRFNIHEHQNIKSPVCVHTTQQTGIVGIVWSNHMRPSDIVSRTLMWKRFAKKQGFHGACRPGGQ